MTPRVSIIIPHWNTPLSLMRLLKLLRKTTEHEIIVVENHSDQPIHSLKDDFPSVIFIENASNRGFAAACNQGATVAHGSWLFFLNPDVGMTADQVTEMTLFAQKMRLDAVSPVPLNKNYSKPLPTPWQLFLEFSPLGKIIDIDSPRKTLTGGALLISKTVLEALGGWDERFFLWFEDSDLTTRLYRGGYRVGWYPESFPHAGGKALKKLPDQIQKHLFFFAMKLYAKKFFSPFGQKLVDILALRYTRRITLPEMEEGVTLVVPNMRLALLKSFFVDNWPILKFFVENGELDLVVVSNALTSQNVWQFRAEYPQVRFILLEKNRGFAATVNMGMRTSIKKWVGTVNDDTILSQNWVNECLSSATKNVGSINPVVVGVDGKVESAGIHVLPRGKAMPVRIYEEQNPFPADATNGAAVLYSHAVLEITGLFDERFGSYLEDIDLSLRIRKQGFINIVCTSTEVIHKKHSTSHKMGRYKRWLDFKNWWLLIFKNWPLEWWVKHFPQILLERGRNFWGIFK